jgi:hypothetical protein
MEVYSIDVEGGQATLVVSPSGESMLIDAGFSGHARCAAHRRGRDDRRHQADRLLPQHPLPSRSLREHSGPDHVAAGPTFVDSGDIAETGKQSVAAFQTYAGFRQKGRHLVVKAGDKVPIGAGRAGRDLRWNAVSAATGRGRRREPALSRHQATRSRPYRRRARSASSSRSAASG